MIAVVKGHVSLDRQAKTGSKKAHFIVNLLASVIFFLGVFVDVHTTTYTVVLEV